jgi:pyruvate kinase
LPNVVNVGSTIFIQEGELITEVVELGDNWVRVICKNNCRLGEQRKMNLPGAQVDLPALT